MGSEFVRWKRGISCGTSRFFFAFFCVSCKRHLLREFIFFNVALWKKLKGTVNTSHYLSRIVVKGSFPHAKLWIITPKFKRQGGSKKITLVKSKFSKLILCNTFVCKIARTKHTGSCKYLVIQALAVVEDFKIRIFLAKLDKVVTRLVPVDPACVYLDDEKSPVRNTTGSDEWGRVERGRGGARYTLPS